MTAFVAEYCACSHAKGDHQSNRARGLTVKFGRCLIDDCDCTIFTTRVAETEFPFDAFEPQDGQHILHPETANPAEGILAGDSLIVRGTDTAEPGQLVVITSHAQASVKRYAPDEPGQVIGLVIAVMRRLK